MTFVKKNSLLACKFLTLNINTKVDLIGLLKDEPVLVSTCYQVDISYAVAIAAVDACPEASCEDKFWKSDQEKSIFNPIKKLLTFCFVQGRVSSVTAPQ